MPTVLALVFAYLIGSVDFAVIISRLHDVDIYAAGSGNPGTSNVYRSVGKRAAAGVLLGDLTKGFLAALIAGVWVGGTVAAAAGFCAVAGHCFPVWHRFRGGRGVATAIGAGIFLAPIAGVALAIGWVAVVITTKTASIASLAAMVLFVPALLIGGLREWSLVWAGAAAVLVIARHHQNIRRIFGGIEPTVESS